jgi:hypothetical protein
MCQAVITDKTIIAKNRKAAGPASSSVSRLSVKRSGTPSFCEKKVVNQLFVEMIFRDDR